MMRRGAKTSQSSTEKSVRTYLFMTRIMGLLIAALGVIFFLLTFNFAILLILVAIGVILYLIGTRQRLKLQ